MGEWADREQQTNLDYLLIPSHMPTKSCLGYRASARPIAKLRLLFGRNLNDRILFKMEHAS